MKNKLFFIVFGLGALVFLAGCAANKEETTVKEGKVVVKEYSDFQCPACAAASQQFKKLVDQYGKDKIEIDFRHFPLTSIHPNSFKAAEAAECARDQSKFEEYHDLLFSKQSDWSKKGVAKFKQYAKDLKLDESKFNQCLDKEEKKSVVENSMKEGDKLGLNSTPTIFIDGKQVEFESWDELGQIIKDKLQ